MPPRKPSSGTRGIIWRHKLHPSDNSSNQRYMDNLDRPVFEADIGGNSLFAQDFGPFVRGTLDIASIFS